MPNLISWILLAAIVSSVSHNVNSAVTHRRPSLEAEDKETNEDTIGNNIRHHDHFPKPRRFIISTTLDQIKLYPFSSWDRSDLNISNNHYILKPANLNLSLDKLQSLVKHQPIGYHKWLLEKRLRTNSTRKASILPGDEAEEYYSNITHYFKPIISDIDYFYSREFCRPRGWSRINNCLIVVWTDTRNNLIHYGSVDLWDSNIRTANYNSTRVANRNRVLLLNTFPPISFKRESQYNKLRINGMVVDKKRRRIHAIYSVGQPQLPVTQKVLSGRFKAINYHQTEDELHMIDLHDEQLLTIKAPCEDPLNITPTNDLGDVMDLGLDERNDGDWLFYRGLGDQHLHVLSTYDRWLEVKGVPLHRSFSNNCSCLDIEVVSIAIDFRRSRLLLLTDQLKIYSSNYEFEGKKLLGRLPLDRTVVPYNRFRMQISYDTLFVGDLAKKSVAAYKLNLGPQGIENEKFFTRQVLLVETPHLGAFRYVEDWQLLWKDTLWNPEKDDAFKHDQDKAITYNQAHKGVRSGTSFDNFWRLLSRPRLICRPSNGYSCIINRFLYQSDLDCSTHNEDRNESVASQSLCGTDCEEPDGSAFFYVLMGMLASSIIISSCFPERPTDQTAEKTDIQADRSSEKPVTEIRKESHIDKSKLACCGASKISMQLL